MKVAKGKKIKELADKYKNEEMVMFLYDYKLNTKYNNAYDEYYYYIEWISFSEFRKEILDI